MSAIMSDCRRRDLSVTKVNPHENHFMLQPRTSSTSTTLSLPHSQGIRTDDVFAGFPSMSPNHNQVKMNCRRHVASQLRDTCEPSSLLPPLPPPPHDSNLRTGVRGGRGTLLSHVWVGN